MGAISGGTSVRALWLTPGARLERASHGAQELRQRERLLDVVDVRRGASPRRRSRPCRAPDIITIGAVKPTAPAAITQQADAVEVRASRCRGSTRSGACFGAGRAPQRRSRPSRPCSLLRSGSPGPGPGYPIRRPPPVSARVLMHAPSGVRLALAALHGGRPAQLTQRQIDAYHARRHSARFFRLDMSPCSSTILRRWRGPRPVPLAMVVTYGSNTWPIQLPLEPRPVVLDDDLVAAWPTRVADPRAHQDLRRRGASEAPRSRW